MVNKTKIERRMRKKTDSNLAEAIIKLKKTNPKIAKELAKPKRQWTSINLDKIDSAKKDVLIIGKVLSSGDLSKPKKIVAWSASEKALEKIKSVKGEFVEIVNEMKRNPELKDLELLK